jgi:hypothetical protein
VGIGNVDLGIRFRIGGGCSGGIGRSLPLKFVQLLLYESSCYFIAAISAPPPADCACGSPKPAVPNKAAESRCRRKSLNTLAISCKYDAPMNGIEKHGTNEGVIETWRVDGRHQGNIAKTKSEHECHLYSARNCAERYNL